MILRANRTVSFHILSLASISPSFFRASPRASFFRSRDKTAQVGFRDKKEKATACLCILEIILSWRIAIHVGFRCFPLFFLRGQIDISWLKFRLSISVDSAPCNTQHCRVV